MDSMLEDVKNLLNYFAKDCKISHNVIAYLSNPEKVLKVNLPLVMDDGSLKHFTGYRTRYSTALGPAKGGIRFHQNVDEDTINALALLMVLKNSLSGLPYGGGKGGVRVDVSQLSNKEKERLCRLYINSISDFIGENIDIPASDVGISSENIGWMSDEYDSTMKKKSPATITGKPVALGGSLFRKEATGFGVFLSTKKLLEKLTNTTKSYTIAIQGFGNVGLYSAKFLFDFGYKIVAISDVNGGIFDENGINVNLLISKTQEYSNQSLGGITNNKIMDCFPKAKSISNEDLLNLNVDVLVLGAIDDVITQSNMLNIKAKYIIEGANAPISRVADEELTKNGVIIVPDILANSGGVIVSYFEWIQNLQAYYWTSDEVKKKLTIKMEDVFEKVWSVSKKENKSLRSSAYAIALRRIEETIKAKHSCL